MNFRIEYMVGDPEVDTPDLDHCYDDEEDFGDHVILGLITYLGNMMNDDYHHR